VKAMEMEVRPVEADLQDDVKIGQGAVDCTRLFRAPGLKCSRTR
jgi:hypothetical protein